MIEHLPDRFLVSHFKDMYDCLIPGAASGWADRTSAMPAENSRRRPRLVFLDDADTAHHWAENSRISSFVAGNT